MVPHRGPGPGRRSRRDLRPWVRSRAHVSDGPRTWRLVPGPVEQYVAPGAVATRRRALAGEGARAVRARARSPLLLRGDPLASLLGGRGDRRENECGPAHQGVPGSGRGPGGRRLRRPLARLVGVPLPHRSRRLHRLGLGLAFRTGDAGRCCLGSNRRRVLAEPFAGARRAERDCDMGAGHRPRGDRRGPRVQPANRSRHDHPPRSRAGLLPRRPSPRRLARVAGPGPRDEDACRLGAHRQERQGAAGVAHAVRRFGARHRRTADRISDCEVHVGPVVAVPAPEAAPNRHRPLARPHRRLGAGRRPVHRLRDLAAPLRRRHEDAPLRANRPPRGLGAPRRHDAARGFRLAQRKRSTRACESPSSRSASYRRYPPAPRGPSRPARLS